MEQILCGHCQKPISNKTEVEYSEEINEYFCDPDCARDRYFDYMQSRPIDFSLDDGFVIKRGKLFEKEWRIIYWGRLIMKSTKYQLLETDFESLQKDFLLYKERIKDLENNQPKIIQQTQDFPALMIEWKGFTYRRL